VGEGSGPSALQIRPALLSDAEAIAILTTELGYPTSADQILARLDVLLPHDSHFVAVAERDSRVVGWVGVEERMLLESGKRAELVGLVVAEQSRRTGIGKLLVLEAESWARRRGLDTIGVRSNVVRVEAHPFHENLGYARSKTQHAYSKRLGDA
jgi:GNAT superfamily N-acetyltransferase